MSQNGFVSFMLEKDDSYQFQPTVNQYKIDNDDDFYRQLSQEFYGEDQFYFCKHDKKENKSVDSSKLKQKLQLQFCQVQKTHQVPNSIQRSQLIQQKIYKLFTKQSPSHQSQFKQTQRSVQKTRNFIEDNSESSLKLDLSNSQRSFIQNPKKFQLKVFNENGSISQTQTTPRSVIDHNLKHSAKQEKIIDIYYPVKLSPYKKDTNSLFKLSFRNKP